MKLFLNIVAIAALSTTLLTACGGDSDSSGGSKAPNEPLSFSTLPSCPIVNNTVQIGRKTFDGTMIRGKCKVKTPKLINGREFTLICIGRGAVNIETADDVDPNIIKNDVESLKVFNYQCV